MTIKEAQKTLDDNNKHFQLLEWKGSRAKNLTKCLKCGHIWPVVIQSIRSNTTPTQGCPECLFRLSKAYKNLTEKNMVKVSQGTKKGTLRVKCLSCFNEFERFTSNLTDKNFNCPCCQKVDLKHYRLKKILELDDLQVCYLIGFFIADGHFSSNRLSVTLSSKDDIFLREVSKYLLNEDVVKKRVYRGNEISSLSVMDTDTIHQLRNRFLITNNKTVEPPSVRKLTQDQLTALYIGFIDGDGHLGFRVDNGNSYYSIKIHKNWEAFLTQLTEHFYGIVNKQPPKVFLVNNKYIEVRLGNQDVITFLNDFARNELIFTLERKRRF